MTAHILTAKQAEIERLRTVNAVLLAALDLRAACAYAADYLALVMDEKSLGKPGACCLEKLRKALKETKQ